MTERTLSKVTLEFPYKRTLGPVVGAFLTGLRDGRILGNRTPDGKVQCPPHEYDPWTGEDAGELVQLPDIGVVRSWAWVAEPLRNHPLDRPFAWALIRLYGADTDLLHAVDASRSDRLQVGTQVKARWRSERRGHITDIECFEPAEPEVDASELGARTLGSSSEGPVEMMDAPVSLDYYYAPTLVQRSYIQAMREHRLIGHRCTECGRIYSPPRGYCPICIVETTEADQVELPQAGIVTTFTIVQPDPTVYGQERTERYVNATVRLDGTENTITGEVKDIPLDEVRTGLRVEPVWREDLEGADLYGRGRMGATGIAYWRPTGAPDAPPEEIGGSAW